MTHGEVLGHPEYDPEFGPVPDSRYGAGPGLRVAEEAMTALVPGGCDPVSSGAVGCPGVFGG